MSHFGLNIVFVAHTMCRGPCEVTLETVTEFDRNAATISSMVASAQPSPGAAQLANTTGSSGSIGLRPTGAAGSGSAGAAPERTPSKESTEGPTDTVGGASGGPQTLKSSAMRHHWSVTASSAVSLNSRPKHETLVLVHLGHAAGPS